MVRYRKIDLRRSILENFPKYQRKFTTQQQLLAHDICAGLMEVNGLLEKLDTKMNVVAMDR